MEINFYKLFYKFSFAICFTCEEISLKIPYPYGYDKIGDVPNEGIQNLDGHSSFIFFYGATFGYRNFFSMNALLMFQLVFGTRIRTQDLH